MARALMVIIISMLALGACTQRMICPAYQSAFIYDKESLRKKFSYFVDDSTPKILTASKTKYLIAEPVSYASKLRQLQTVEMTEIHPIVPDSLLPGYEPPSLAELDSAANSIIDSTYIVDVEQQEDTTQTTEDSVYVITKDKEVRLLKYDMDSLKYSVVEVRLNVDQDNYMWYLRDHLVLPDVRLAKLQAGGGAKAETKKEKKGFFRNLFKKKKKDKPDSATVVPNKTGEEFDYIDTVQQEPPTTQTELENPKKKGGLFSKKKDDAVTSDGDNAITPSEEKPKKKKKEKKKKKDDVVTEEIQPANKEEEKDDGF